MDSLIGQWSHSFVGWLQLSCGIAVLSLPKDVPSFQMVVEVPRVMVASEVAVGCPLAQTTGRVPRGEQPRFLVTLRGDNPRRRSAASHVEHAGPLVNRATGERQHRRQVEPRFHGEGNRRTDLGCCIRGSRPRRGGVPEPAARRDAHKWSQIPTTTRTEDDCAVD